MVSERREKEPFGDNLFQISVQWALLFKPILKVATIDGSGSKCHPGM